MVISHMTVFLGLFLAACLTVTGMPAGGFRRAHEAAERTKDAVAADKNCISKGFGTAKSHRSKLKKRVKIKMALLLMGP